MTLDELLYAANQRAIKLEAELTAARAETTRVLSELVACQDQRAALRVNNALMKTNLELAQDLIDALQANVTFLRDR